MENDLPIFNDLKQVKEFLALLSRGSPKYSMLVKKKKTVTNFPFSLKSFKLTQPEMASRSSPLTQYNLDCNNSSRWFPWCGFLIHDTTLEIRLDLSRYNLQNSVSEMKKTISFNYTATPWGKKSIAAIVASNVKSLGWPLCFVPMVNSRRIRLYNAFELLIIIYRKLYTMDVKMHKFSDRLHHSPLLFGSIVEIIGKVAASRLSSLTKHSVKKFCKQELRNTISKGAMLWLSHEAALVALKPNRGQFFKCLKLVQIQQKQYKFHVKRHGGS